MQKTKGARQGFTLVELMTVVTIMAMLMTLVMGIQRYASDKSLRSRAEVEVRAMAAACENYKTDQAVYPNSDETKALSSLSANPSDYLAANLDLYRMISGDLDLNGKPDAAEGKAGAPPAYLEFKSSQLRMPGGMVTRIRDPWDSEAVAEPYGYSTRRASMPEDASGGYNTTFDLWSIAKKPAKPAAWITNW
jgi:prepilin-type N-terminal cleavage/methylation domain-containing protein